MLYKQFTKTNIATGATIKITETETTHWQLFKDACSNVG